jgi:hypothetical protein
MQHMSNDVVNHYVKLPITQLCPLLHSTHIHVYKKTTFQACLLL